MQGTCHLSFWTSLNEINLKPLLDARINFEEVTKMIKKACRCGTRYCPQWECCCEEDEVTGELEGGCTCPPCGCENCSQCKVRSNKYKSVLLECSKNVFHTLFPVVKKIQLTLLADPTNSTND